MRFSVFGKQIAITMPRQARPEITFTKQGAVVEAQSKPSFQVTPRSVVSAADRALCTLNTALMRLQSTSEMERKIVVKKSNGDFDVVTSLSQSESRDEFGGSSTVLWISSAGHKSTRKKRTEQTNTTT
ncbi:unnamed protein product [Candidula unifasciata]|uniref:Uncharacterized protein n=1 Tax=Candidula unifasciata TaxID=100452 RepID=A0A8S3ZYH7_9EUPU|nr:unnamed protein product [Candidula unifasciata]